MGIFRLYTGGDGQSHIGELDLSTHPELTSPLAASTINFREWPRGHFLDWHPAPRRQYIIPLFGAIEIRLRGGRVHRFVPGGARLVEDSTEAGHTTRVLGDQTSVDAIIPLA